MYNIGVTFLTWLKLLDAFVVTLTQQPPVIVGNQRSGAQDEP